MLFHFIYLFILLTFVGSKLKMIGKILLLIFDILQRSAKRQNCPGSGISWPGGFGDLKLMLQASQLQRHQ